MFRPRNPPRYTTTLYDADILYDADLRYDGITIIDPTWDDRPVVTSDFTARTWPQTLYTWWTADITWEDASLTWAGDTVPTWQTRITP